MGGRGSNSMDRLKAGSHTAAAARVSEVSTAQKAKSAAEGALTRAQKRQELAHASVNLFDGDKSSKAYSDLIAERDKADAAYIKAHEKMIEAASNLNKATERAQAPTWSRGTQTIADRQSSSMKGYASSDGKYFVYKDAGGRYRLYSISGRKTVSQGSDLTFNRLKDAQDYASELTSKRKSRKKR